MEVHFPPRCKDQIFSPSTEKKKKKKSPLLRNCIRIKSVKGKMLKYNFLKFRKLINCIENNLLKKEELQELQKPIVMISCK